MSVEFFPCQACSESVCDCGPSFWCKSCKSKLCDDCAAEYDCYEDESNCPFCSMELIKDADLLNFALEVFGITREEFVEDYRKDKR